MEIEFGQREAKTIGSNHSKEYLMKMSLIVVGCLIQYIKMAQLELKKMMRYLSLFPKGSPKNFEFDYGASRLI